MSEYSQQSKYSQQSQQLQQLKDGYNLQSEIIKYTPGGMHVCYLSQPIHLEYASDGLCAMLGYTREEFEELTQQKYINNIIEEDQQIFIDFVVDLSKNYTTKTVEYHMIKKDGGIIIVSDTMESKMCSDGIVRGYSSVTDISKQKSIALELEKQKEQYKKLYTEIKKSETRFRMISSFSGIMFYEYDIEKQMYISCENVEGVLLYSKEQIQKYFKEIRAYESDIPIWGELYYLFAKEDQQATVKNAKELEKTGHTTMELRILCGDYQYHWFLMDVYLNEQDKKIEMGCLRNIDATRQQLDSLKLKTMLDPMTTLMNKVSAFNMIDQYLKDNPANNALLFLDVDDFKSINDQLGHEVGDKVICYIAEILKRTFRERDILVRYGGDEFVVFMKNVRDKKAVFKRATQIIAEAAKCPYLKNTGIQLSFSIGIAFSHENSSARTLSIEADEANYKVKHQGKNGVYNKHYIMKGEELLERTNASPELTISQ